MIRFFVAGVPKSMAVGKTFSVKKRKFDPATGAPIMHESHFQSRTNTEWAVLVGHIGRQHAPRPPMKGPIAFAARFFLPRPTDLPKSIVALPIKRPDLDNLFHKLTDQWNGVLWTDDSVICDVTLSKRYAPAGQPPGVEITVEEAPGGAAAARARPGSRRTPMTFDAPPPQPTLPDVLPEPLNGPETIVDIDAADTTPAEPPPPQQLGLIPMTEDELREAGAKLASKVAALAAMKQVHRDERAEMTREREELEAEIQSIAQTIRQQGR
jgi:Holliday junction resolvase RusA-like endonuclease